MKRPLKLICGCLAAVALPVLLVGLVLSPLYLGLSHLLSRLRLLPRWRTVQLDEGGLLLSWSCRDGEDGRQALEEAVAILLEMLPRCCPVGTVRAVEVINPPSGMVIDPARLRLVEGDRHELAAGVAAILVGGKVEYGALRLVGEQDDGAESELLLPGLEVDARWPLAGSLWVELRHLVETPITRQALREIAERHGYTVS